MTTNFRNQNLLNFDYVRKVLIYMSKRILCVVRNYGDDFDGRDKIYFDNLSVLKN